MATTIHPGFAFWSSWGEVWQVLVLVSARNGSLNECLLHPCFVLARIWFRGEAQRKKFRASRPPAGFGVSPRVSGVSFSLVEQLWD
jgi:hypothetical protein